METILQINSSRLQFKLRGLQGVNANSKSALETVKTNLSTKALTANNLRSCIYVLESCGYDPAVEQALQVLRSSVSKERLSIALAFESIANETRKQFFSVGYEAQTALSDLYNLNSALIMQEINSGALDQWKFNPTIAALIQMAKRGTDSRSSKSVALMSSSDGADGSSVTPAILLAYVSEDEALLMIGKDFYVRGKNGGLTPRSKASIDGLLTTTVRSLVDGLSMFEVNPDNPSQLLPTKATSSVLSEVGISGLVVDMSSDASSFIQINGRNMAYEQFASFFDVTNEDYVLARTTVSGFGDAVATLLACLQAIANNSYGTLLDSFYQKLTFSADGSTTTVYLGNSLDRYAIIVSLNGEVVSCKTYNTAYELLSDASVANNISVHSAAEILFSSSLNSEASKYNARKQLADKMTKDLAEYKSLLKKIETDLSELWSMPDANDEKITSLTELRDRVSTSIERAEASLADMKL